MKHLREYYESAFANEYYPVALDAYNMIAEAVQADKSCLHAFRSQQSSFVNPGELVTLKGFYFDDERFYAKFPKLKVVFFSQSDLKKIGVYGYLAFFRPGLFGQIGFLIGKATLACCVPDGGKKITSDTIVKLFKSGGVSKGDVSGSFKHTFIHEFTHYLQVRKIVYVTNPADVSYTEIRMEKEAWMVMALSEFLEHSPKALLKKCAANYEVFHDEFIKYVIGRDQNGLRLFEFWSNLSDAQKEQFLREAFVILKQRVHGSVGV